MKKLYIPQCEEPLLLVNRSSVNQISLGGSLFIDGELCTNISSYNISSFNLSYFYHLLPDSPTIDDVERFVVYNGRYIDYLFTYVPCNKCVLCRSKKQNDLVFRSALESAIYDIPPYFFTLTYAPAFLPPHGELRYKDVQDFFKRLRRLWDKRGIKHSIRYIVSGEYGSKRHRAHYHIILFNNPLQASESNPRMHRQLKSDILSSWSKCLPIALDFGQCHGGAASYATKYLSKVNPPTFGHWIKPFVHCSNGHGGIGSAKIDEFINYARNNLSVSSISFRDFNGQFKTVNYGSYISQRIWPSPIRLVPANVKSLYKQYCDIVILMCRLRLLISVDGEKMCENIRPYKNVLPNRFNYIDSSKYLYRCSTALRLYNNRFSKCLSDLHDSLFPFKDMLVDEDYINLYYDYKINQPSVGSSSLAWKSMRARERVKNSEMKEKL